MEKKIKTIIVIVTAVVTITAGLLVILFFGAESRCQCADNDTDNFVGTWESDGSGTETTYYSNGLWKAISSSYIFNGTWEIKNGSFIRTMYHTYMGEEVAGVPIEYGYEFSDNCNQLKTWFRADEENWPTITYFYYTKKC